MSEAPLTTNHRHRQLKIARRPLLIGALGAAAATLTACTESASSADYVGFEPRVATHLHIIAHPDDDFYFFNLDLARAIQEGHKVVTVCLTAGESDGRNIARNAADWSGTKTDHPAYAAARFTGARRTYAQMATGKTDAKWDREQLTLSNHLSIEKATLSGAVDITLLYMSLWEDSSHSKMGDSVRLSDLWGSEDTRQSTLQLADGTVTSTSIVSKSELVNSLVELLEIYKPDVVRVMDPDPDPQVHDADNPQFAEQDGYSDHIDHTGAALFAVEAVTQWLTTQENPSTQVVSYRGYYNQRWPRNLSMDARKEKGLYLDTYAWADGQDCGDPSGCGDLKLPADGVGKRYGGSTAQRYTGSDPVLVPDNRGGLHAFSVHSGRPTLWSEPKVGSRPWKRVDLARELPWLPAVDAAADQTGKLLIAGLEYRLDTSSKSHDRNLTVAEVDPADPASTVWHDLGNPEGTSGRGVRNIGVPKLVVTPDGVRMVLVRNKTKGLSGRIGLGQGQWSDWIDFGGKNTQDGLSVIIDYADGSVLVFAAASDGIRYWRIVDHDEFSTHLLTVDPPAGPVTAAADHNGRIVVAVRQAGTSAIQLYQRPGPDKDWDTTRTVLGGDGGVGIVPIKILRAWEPTLAMLHRNDDTTLSFQFVNYLKLGEDPTWRKSGPRTLRPPSLGIDRDGRLVAAAMGMDGRMYCARQKKAGTGQIGEWRVIAGDTP